MARNIRDLREIINISRLSIRDEEDFQSVFSSDEDEETSSLRGYITSRPSSALGTRSCFQTLSSNNDNNNNNNNNNNNISTKRPVSAVNSSRSEQSIRPSTVPIKRSSHEPRKSNSSQSLIGRDHKQFPSHYTPVPPILSKDDKKKIRDKNPRIRKNTRRNFDEVLSYLDSAIVNEWLEECNDTIQKLSSFATEGAKWVSFCHFLLEGMKHEDYCHLLDVEFSIIVDRLKYGFHAGFTTNQLNDNDLLQLASSAIPEYPGRLKQGAYKGVEALLDIFVVLSSSDRTDQYRELLKSINCVSVNKQCVQWLLAIRAHGLISFVSGILRFFENIHSDSVTSASVGREPVLDFSGLVNTVSSDILLKRWVCCAITAGKLKVLDYLNRRNAFTLDGMLDERGRNIIFQAIESNNEEIVYYLCQVSHVILR